MSLRRKPYTAAVPPRQMFRRCRQFSRDRQFRRCRQFRCCRQFRRDRAVPPQQVVPPRQDRRRNIFNKYEFRQKASRRFLSYQPVKNQKDEGRIKINVPVSHADRVSSFWKIFNGMVMKRTSRRKQPYDRERRMVQERADRMQAERASISVRVPQLGCKARHFCKDTGRNLSPSNEYRARGARFAAAAFRKEEDQKDIIN